MQEALSAAAISLDPFLTMAKSKREKLVTYFETAIADIDTTEVRDQGREEGGCWLWLTDSTHEITRALLMSDRVRINSQGRYLVELPFDLDLSLGKREELTRRLAALLNERHGLRATYHSVLWSFNFDEIPHYSNPPFENRLIFNFGSDEGDE